MLQLDSLVLLLLMKKFKLDSKQLNLLSFRLTDHQMINRLSRQRGSKINGLKLQVIRKAMAQILIHR
jgi:hypothetical protein